ncbi:MAG: EamA family transporter RarD [Phascolarctobacterium sp.]|nr:EamA family transporter RarD [Phascolarctobacterium sp.]
MEKNFRLGIFYGLSAYFLWGILPVYWKMLLGVSAFEILASRFIWSMVFVGLLLAVTGKLQVFFMETYLVFSTLKTGAAMIAAAITIAFNWGIFIWAVEDGRILETSMGYYINPIVSVLFGMVFLKERLDGLQKIAVCCACIGIGIMLVKNGSFPWISLGLAGTFALYGLLKKIIPVAAMTSIMLETLLISPIALWYVYYLNIVSISAYIDADPLIMVLLMGAGIVTSTPLLLFTGCAKLLPLKMVGFMQYVSPTISLLLGVFVYGENFSSAHLLAFGWIWVSLALFTWGQLKTK